jgi:hypothetical protein
MSAVVHQDKLYNRYLLFSVAHAALIHESKNLLARNQENVSEWGFAYIYELLFLTKRVGILQSKHHHYRKAARYSCK